MSFKNLKWSEHNKQIKSWQMAKSFLNTVTQDNLCLYLILFTHRQTMQVILSLFMHLLFQNKASNIQIMCTDAKSTN